MKDAFGTSSDPRTVHPAPPDSSSVVRNSLVMQAPFQSVRVSAGRAHRGAAERDFKCAQAATRALRRCNSDQREVAAASQVNAPDEAVAIVCVAGKIERAVKCAHRARSQRKAGPRAGARAPKDQVSSGPAERQFVYFSAFVQERHQSQARHCKSDCTLEPTSSRARRQSASDLRGVIHVSQVNAHDDANEVLFVALERAGAAGTIVKAKTICKRAPDRGKSRGRRRGQ